MSTDINQLVELYESMKTKHRVSKVIIVNGNRVLLLQKNGTLRWELPGGHSLTKEHMKDTAVREVKEETGQKIDVVHLKYLQSLRQDGNKYKWYTYTQPFNKKIKISKEHVDYKWVSKNNLENYKLSKTTNHLAIISVFN